MRLLSIAYRQHPWSFRDPMSSVWQLELCTAPPDEIFKLSVCHSVEPETAQENPWATSLYMFYIETRVLVIFHPQKTYMYLGMSASVWCWNFFGQQSPGGHTKLSIYSVSQNVSSCHHWTKCAGNIGKYLVMLYILVVQWVTDQMYWKSGVIFICSQPILPRAWCRSVVLIV